MLGHAERELITQSITHLRVESNGPNAYEGFSVDLHTTNIETYVPPLPGMANLEVEASGGCGSDFGPPRNIPGGYFRGGRYHKDLFGNSEKLNNNIAIMRERGYVGSDELLLNLIKTPNHEYWGVIVDATPNPDDIERAVAAFVPVTSDDGTQIIGVRYSVESVNPQALERGDWVVGTAYLRCDQHWQIPEGKKFPENCDRSTANGHVRKQVPGHGEIPGGSIASELGMPFPNQMLIKIPDAFKQFILGDPKRLSLPVVTEPLSCCFEALQPILLGVEDGTEPSPKKIVIGGDGLNGALLALTATSIFPDADVYVTGRTPQKLEEIRQLNPKKIHVIQEGKDEKSSDVQLKETLNGETVDIFIPTFHAKSLEEYDGLVNKDTGWVMVWAADQVGDHTPFEGIVPDERIRDSYGGWNWAELSALLLLTTLSQTNPERLDALSEYVTGAYIPLAEAAEPMQQAIANGRREIVIGQGDQARKTGSKLLMWHKPPDEIFNSQTKNTNVDRLLTNAGIQI